MRDSLDRLRLAEAHWTDRPDAAPFLADALSDEVSEIRELAAYALDSMDQIPADVVPQLTAALQDHNRVGSNMRSDRSG